MKNMLSPKTIRIGDSSLLNKKRRVNTSAGCYLLRKTDNGIQLLVIKKTFPNRDIRYVLPKGHKEWEESLEEATIRETKEESGYTDFKLLRYLGSSTYEIDGKREIQMKTDHYFLAILNGDTKEDKQSEVYEDDVVVENEWIDLGKGLELLTFENNPQIHTLLKEYVQKDIV